MSPPHASVQAASRRGPPLDLRFLGDGFVFDATWGTFHRVSPAAAFLLRTLADGKARRDLPALLSAQYGIEPARAARDVERFLQDLRSVGLIGGVA